MTYQKILRRILSSYLMGSYGRRLLHRRIWTIEGGKGAGMKICFPQNLDYIAGSSEQPVQEAIDRQLSPGDVFYDVGANVGFFSLISAKCVGSTGCVYSFEPVTENIASINENAKINQLKNIISFEVAVGKFSGNNELLLTDWDGGAALSTSVVKPSHFVSRRDVRVVSLDDFIIEKKLRMPSLVKIDVEGSELDVIQGMSRTIAECKPALLFEIDDGKTDAFHHRWKELDQFIYDLGYRILHLKDSYPNINWKVGHSLALPIESSDKIEVS